MPKVMLRKISPYREIDYVQLKSALVEYADPHAKIRQWLASGALIRIKKGLYILGDHENDTAVSLEILANLMYGPSAISLDYALAYYGMIPEHVRTVTSITPQRDKVFSTPIGNFSYRYLTMKKYCIGLTRTVSNDGRNILIATPEKALADKIYFSKLLALKNQEDVENFLFFDLRMEENTLLSLKKYLLCDIALAYKNTQVTAIINYLLKR